MVTDMTVGNPTKLIMKFAFPLLIGNIFQQLYNLSDIVIVGRLIGVHALAAVGASAPLFFMLLLITLGFTGGLTVVTAQRFGAKDPEGVRKSVTHSVMASSVLSFAITAFMTVFTTQVLKMMNVPEDIMADAYTFIFLLSLGLPLIVCYNLLSGFIRALGDSKTPLYFLIFSSVLNILLNLVLIYYAGMGVAGSALGTIIAISISVICCVYYIGRKFPILKLKKSDWAFDAKLMNEHLNIAFPMSLQFSIIAVGLMIIQSVCNSFGKDVIAAFTAALRLEQLGTQPLLALGLAIATYSAQNYGAGMIARIRKGVFFSSIYSVTFSILLALLVRFVGEEMIGIFLKEGNDNIIKIAKDYLNISTMFYLFLGQIFIFRNALQGMGRTKIPLLACVVELIVRSLAAIILAKQIGYIGICYASPIAWVGAALVVTIGYVIVIRKMKKHYWSNQIKKIRSRFKREENILLEHTSHNRES